MTPNQKNDLKQFCIDWCNASSNYKKIMGKDTYRINFPDPLQKLIIEDVFPNTYKKNPRGSGKTYDYTDVATSSKKVEIKSSSGNGITPFKKDQNACDIILYLDVQPSLGIIDIYELSTVQVTNVNKAVTGCKGDQANISLSGYLSGAKKTTYKM